MRKVRGIPTVVRTAGRDKTSPRGRFRAASLLTWAILLGTPAISAAQVPPDAAWRSLESEHFRVTFPAHMESLARRAAGIAERARSRLTDSLIEAPPETIELLLTDHVDGSNGFASVSGNPTVTIWARPPIDGFALSHFDDWLDLVVTHEVTHILHLDHAGGPSRLFRALFGRVPAAWPYFPGSATPRWVVEGLATRYESSLSGWGRVEGTWFDMVLRTAALEGKLEPIDAVSGESPDWPSGQRPYAYGSLFFEWLLDRYGAERMGRFVDAVASQWVPYRLNSAAKRAFGVSFSEAWEVWRSERIAEARTVAETVAARAPRTAPVPLTAAARQALHPRSGPDGSLVYARADGRSDPQLRVRDVDGDERGIRTNGLATLDLAPDGSVVFSQLEVVDEYEARTDLYRWSPEDGVRRLTRDARLEQPTVGADGRLWAVRIVPGATRIVRVDPDDGEVTPLPELPDDSDWGFPAVSPDGRTLAAVRWRRSAEPDLVLLDPVSGAVVRAVTDDRALELAPTWAPDGTLVWVSDRSGIPNLYAAPGLAVDDGAPEVRQITDVATGVGFPDVSADGESLVFSVYHAEGWELARIPYDPAGWAAPVPAAPRFATPRAEARREVESVDAPVVEYSPWPTLRPRYWEPVAFAAENAGGRRVLGPWIGAGTSVEDVIGRHALGAEAAVGLSKGRVRVGLGYAYRGLGVPILSLSASQFHDASGPFGVGEGGDRVYLVERERRIGADVTVPVTRWRRAWSLGLGGGLVQERRELLDTDLEPSRDFALSRPTSRLADLRLSLSMSTARGHALSISAESGTMLSVRVRSRAELDVPAGSEGVAGEDRGFDEAIGRLRLYRSFRGWGFADHVIAFEGTAGAARGPGADGFHFEVGGASGLPEPITGFGLFGGGPLTFPVRGYVDGDRAGRYAWTASAEWRFPLALVDRGLGLIPFHLDRLHAALFGDAGNAWGPEYGIPGYQSPRARTLISVGGELRAELLTFFTVPVSLRVGTAFPLVEGDGARVYLRFGRAF